MANNKRSCSWLPPRPGNFPLGSMESRAAARAVNLAEELESQRREAHLRASLTPFQKAFLEGRELNSAWLIATRAIEEKSRIFGWALPTADEIRHKRRVADEMKKIKRAEPTLNENEIRQKAEERLKS